MSAYDGEFNETTQHLLILADEEVCEWRGMHGHGSRRNRRLWERWKSGQCVADIARALERRNKSGVYRVLAGNGGIAPAPRRRALVALRLEEREEISRGIAAGRSIRPKVRSMAASPV